MDITITTTDAEDIAITKVTGETPDAFILRHCRHQIDFVVRAAVPDLAITFDAATDEDKAVLEALAEKYRSKKPAKSAVTP